MTVKLLGDVYHTVGAYISLDLVNVSSRGVGGRIDDYDSVDKGRHLLTDG